jgi:hypothetical protein
MTSVQEECEMSEQSTEPDLSPDPPGSILSIGGLEFDTSFRSPNGATLRVYGEVEGKRTELLRFDDFVESPHYHAPSAGPSMPIDREEVGAPLEWFVTQLRDHLDSTLAAAGFGELLPQIDLAAVTRNADQITRAMEDCVPDGYVRIDGFGLQRADA